MPLKRGEAPVSVRKQQQLQAEKQKQAEQQKKKQNKDKNSKRSGKRKGPLPLWLAEIGVLGSFAGIAALAFSAGKEGGKGDGIGRSIAALLEKLIPPKKA